jgi:hypothetical protein
LQSLSTKSVHTHVDRKSSFSRNVSALNIFSKKIFQKSYLKNYINTNHSNNFNNNNNNCNNYNNDNNFNDNDDESGINDDNNKKIVKRDWGNHKGFKMKFDEFQDLFDKKGMYMYL